MPSSPFCTCGNLNCPLHPSKHDQGCAPCIQKNLRLREVPNCFFNLLDHPEGRPGESLEDFAKLVWQKRDKPHTKSSNHTHFRRKKSYGTSHLRTERTAGDVSQIL